MRKDAYTTEEIQFLKDNYSDMGPKACGEALGRPAEGIRGKANSLKLKVSEATMNKLRKKASLVGGAATSKNSKPLPYPSLDSLTKHFLYERPAPKI